MLDVDRLLLYLARKGALSKEIEISTIKMAEETGSTQQTMSRKMIELSEKGLIERSASTKGVRVRLSSEGAAYLKSLYAGLEGIFTEKSKTIIGKVKSGLGEGAYYMSQDCYVREFESKLGMKPFPGTLNLNVSPADFMAFSSGEERVYISGFETKSRSFGGLIAYKSKVNGIYSAIIVPDRTSHKKDTIELISQTYFRRKFKLKDGDEVGIEPWDTK
ncbi:CTP-dependent riboflavin kinase [Candidatus Woesearchaeota archaeon]|nr:CTP-dependent riboflavin kinase [Candidatus Woesearchaeota archaeon]